MDHFTYRNRAPALRRRPRPCPGRDLRHAAVRLQQGDAAAPPEAAADGLRRRPAADLLQHQDQRQPAHLPADGRRTAPASTSPAAASCFAPWRPGARATRSSLPASARPMPRFATPWRTTSFSSTSRAKPSCTALGGSGQGDGQAGRRRPARQSRSAAQDARQDRYQRQRRQVRPGHRHRPRRRPAAWSAIRTCSVVGLHMHLGSPILSTSRTARASTRALA